MFTKIFKKIFQHKFITIMVLALLASGFYFGNKAINSNSGALRYAVAAVEKGTLIVSVSGSGQVTVLDQVDVKPKVSGDVTAIYINKDDEVKTGQLLATLDSTDAEKAIRDAQIALDSAKRDLDEAKEDYQDIEIDAERSLTTAYEDGYSAVSSAFFKLSDYMKDLKDVLGTENSEKEYITGYELVLGRDSLFIQKLINDYYQANGLYNKNFAFFRTVFQNDDRDTIYKLISDTIDTTKAISQALESARHMYDAAIMNESYKRLTIASQIDKMQPKIESDVSAVYSNISSLQKIKDTIDDTDKDTPKKIEDAQLAIQSAQNTVVQKEDALLDAKEKLANCFIRAPFNGVIVKVSAKKGDAVSSGTTLATLITKQKIAEIALNEIDAANIKVNQKVTLTFDALPDVSITGRVVEVDTVGQVSQGVVSYGVKIAFDTDVEQVKPGMSVTVDIITEAKQDVLVLPNGAIKSQGDTYYVELVEADEQLSQQLLANVSGAVLPKSPKIQTVEVGLSNDLSTEIVSGLKEGDIVVTSTINSSQNQAIQSRPNQSFQILETGGGATRTFR